MPYQLMYGVLGKASPQLKYRDPVMIFSLEDPHVD